MNSTNIYKSPKKFAYSITQSEIKDFSKEQHRELNNYQLKTEELNSASVCNSNKRSNMPGNSGVIPSHLNMKLEDECCDPHKDPNSTEKEAKTCIKCNCKNSKCLKLYCECFRAGHYCGGCNCINCRN